MWPLFEIAADSDSPMIDKLTYLTLLTHAQNLNIEDDQDVHIIIEKIDELVSSALTRSQGLFLMDAVLRFSPTVYIRSWGQILIPGLQSSDYYMSKELMLRILNQVVRNFSKEPVYKEAFNRYIPEVLPILLAVDQRDMALHFYCQSLALCMSEFPDILGRHENEIEKFLMKHVNAVSNETRMAIAECFTALPRCLMHAPGVRKKQYADVWLDVYDKTLCTVQALLNDLLEVPGEACKYIEVNSFALFDIPFDSEQTEFSHVLSRVRVFSTLCCCLAKMLSSRTCRLKVPVQELLGCLNRIFEFKEKFKGVGKISKSKVEALTLCYPVMQDSVFIILEVLILNFGIIEQSGNFTRFVRESIEISNLTMFSSPSLRPMRSSTWKIMNIWLKQYGTKASIDLVNDKYVIHELLKEIECESSESTPSQVEVPLLKVEPSATHRVECCIEAIRVLKNIYLMSGSYLDAELETTISSTVLKVVRNVQQSGLLSGAWKTFPSPYNDQICRKKLYDILLKSCLHGETLRVKHNRQVVNAFKIAQKDPSLEVTKVCHKASKFCRYLINPKKPPPESQSKVVKEHSDHSTPTKENISMIWNTDIDLNMSNGSPQNERVMDIPLPCQIETVYHTSSENEGQRDGDVLPNQALSPNHFPEPPHDNQCNSDSNRLVSNDPPSHSDVGEESESDDDRIYCDEDAQLNSMQVDIPQIATQVPINNSVDPHSSVPEKITELTTLEQVIKTSNQMNCPEDEEMDDMPIVPSPKGMTAENGMDESEEESAEEEGEEGDDDDETGDYSSEYYQDHGAKRQKINNNGDEHSEEDYEDETETPVQPEEVANVMCGVEEDGNDTSNSIPSVKEMCRAFVFAEPAITETPNADSEEIS